MDALVDSSSTHSYIYIEQLSDKLPSVEPLAYDMTCRLLVPWGIVLELTECIRTVL